jgi:DNA mismatch endonuclease (patch repair protein)
MQLQRTRDTGPELTLRPLIHAAGLRYRVDRAPLPGIRRRADVVFGPARVAVYADGCFWHGCPEHGSRPRANSAYWENKLDGDRRRDADTDRRLALAGWQALRIWEHEDPAAGADRDRAAVRRRGPGRSAAAGAA